MTGFESWLVSMGLTRDSVVWFWSRLVTGAFLIVSGVVPTESYLGPKWAKVLQISATVVLFFAGKYDSSPLPGKPVSSEATHGDATHHP